MRRVFIPSTGPEDWKRGLANPDRQWQPGYSAMSVARSWEAAKGVPDEIAALFDAPVELLLAIPEYVVALPGGGKGSQCDVFALLRSGGETCALAVEAKVAEPFGPTVAEWMSTPSNGKETRLAFIASTLGLKEIPPDTRYQLLHRTAAAVVEAQRFKTDSAAMIVQSFSETGMWFSEFQDFASLFGLSPGIGNRAEVELSSGLRLHIGWAKGTSV